MAKRKVLKVTPVLVTLNILVLLIIASFYITRLVKYYLLENGPVEEGTTILLVDEIKKKQSFLDETKGLVLDEKTNIYRYKGEVEDNYILYSGFLYRIIAIDNENNIRAVSEDNVTLMYPGFNNGYEKSYVNKWLNTSDENYSGVYEKELINSSELLTETYMCSDVVDDVTNITCDNYYMDKKVTLLSLHDYKEAGGKNSYLNNGQMYYFGTLNSSNQEYFITEDGEIAINKKSNKVVSVKPVITFYAETPLISGNGKKDNPYIVESHDIKTAKDLYINNYIKMGDYTYKVVSVGEDRIKVALNGVLKKDEEDLLMTFGGTSSAYSNTKNTLGAYLNSTYLDSLELKDNILNSDWYIAKLSLNSSDYVDVYKSKVTLKIGMLSLADIYVNEYNNVFTLLRGLEANNIINVINKDGNLFGDKTTSKYNVRTAFYLSGDLIVTKGKGTLEDPFELGVKNEEEGKDEGNQSQTKDE